MYMSMTVYNNIFIILYFAFDGVRNSIVNKPIISAADVAIVR